MKPIAMKCSEKQFAALLPFLKGSHVEVKLSRSLSTHPYLVNNFQKVQGRISNQEKQWAGNFDRTVYDEWNQELFLKCCDIVPHATSFEELLAKLE